MSKKFIQFLIIAIVVATVIIFAFLFMHKHSQQNPPVSQAPLPKAIHIDTSNQPTLGDPKAPIHFVVFEDLKCPICREYNVNIYPQIKKKFIDTKQAKYTFINLTFIPGSMQAASAARCLYTQNPQYFFQFTDYIYHHQGPENENWATIPWLLNAANMIPGVDSDKLSACVLQSPYTNFILSNLDLIKKAVGKIASPYLFINGILVDPLTMPQINKIIAHIRKGDTQP